MGDHLTTHDLLARVEELIGGELEQAERVFLSEVSSKHPYVHDVLQHITRFQGKRLRPILLLLSAAATGGINESHYVLASVVEMIHLATLVHDDVLDDALIRRHVATVNSRWNNETSVLVGDFLFTHAFHLTASLGDARACRLIGRATNLVCEGELAQIYERGNHELGEEQYLEIINGKTAELCAISTQMGALYAGADESIVQAMDEYGRALGVAFQITDDLLDLLGDEEQMGKSLGSDLQKEKLTLPLIRLLDQCSPEDRATLQEILSQPDPNTRQRLTQYIKNSDAIDYAGNRAREFAKQARDALQNCPASPARQILEELTEFAIQRTI
ncbi:polyprenyl synthetase family protein [Gimesia sp.]|uniref:polyprenyl synthetase family protein n=1 Tax=Gimesia sp. TaxID=2024833 RepID=UPI000C40AA2E|nr:polyprenyl synthetase family protein [Gimesia sp.]MAX36159.1 polyprenyl synthetase [Gimesia sp.]HAH43421.1 polyprenyl synthetase family protein [Planctomycetaceae bacterium]|tara:strand:+ start:24046 stop:25038 length:993 start_codon:yes stop_codon:yes gene_type:complete